MSSRVGEGVVIDGNIVVTVAKVRGDGVLLAIKGPPGTHVSRGERVLTLEGDKVVTLGDSDATRQRSGSGG
jgi:carbon storage regulator CsrA